MEATHERLDLSRRLCRCAAYTGGQHRDAAIVPFETPEDVLKHRCDHCGGHLGLIVHRYYCMRFCCNAHMETYRRRLTERTGTKIQLLNDPERGNSLRLKDVS